MGRAVTQQQRQVSTAPRAALALTAATATFVAATAAAAGGRKPRRQRQRASVVRGAAEGSWAMGRNLVGTNTKDSKNELPANKAISILGSTGSIGTQTLDICR